jgi:membrane protein DedA with SNARE-associated domain
MEQWLSELFTGHGPSILYVLTLGVLLVAGLGVPIPEEAVFLAAGFAAGPTKVDANIWLLCVIGVVGIILGDSIPFFFGRKYGLSLLKCWPFSCVLSEKSIDKTKQFFEKHGTRTVFIARFVAGLRMPTFFLAGAMGVKYAWFVFFDMLGALISCPVSIWLAYTYGEEVKEKLAESQLAIFIVIGLLVVYTVWHILSHRPEKPTRSVDTEVATAHSTDVSK